MQRIIAALLAGLTCSVGACVVAPPAEAAAWMWLEGNGFSYSAAACATPGAAFFYAWVLWSGPTYAWAKCAGPFGGSGAAAAASPGFGGVGAGYANGIADPQAGISIPAQTVSEGSSAFTGSDPYNTSGDSPFTFLTDPKTGKVNGITFPTQGGENDVAGNIQISAFLYTGSDCALVGGTCPAQDQTQSSGGLQPTDLSGLKDASFGNDITPVAGYWLQPTDIPIGSLTWGPNDEFQASVEKNFVLAAYGDATNIAEPGSLLVLGAGLVALGAVWRRVAAARMRQHGAGVA